MKLSTLVLLPAVCISAVAGEGFLDRRAGRCHPNDICQKGVDNSVDVDPPLSSRLADCKAFNTITVSPYTVTTTVGTGFIAVRIPTGLPVKRQPLNANVVGRAELTPGATATTITPTMVPSYATYCASAAAYYSACSRAGITAVTTTLETPTSTVTTTSDDCPMRRMVKRSGEAMGYEFEDGWDRNIMPGIRIY
ncbi:hypothetical protein EDB80DRAFT_92748 [Ilyonectria destructans]|nr:hypothetical protein EDB80DRAFT_92748 [Ilyonectria destructans]